MPVLSCFDLAQNVKRQIEGKLLLIVPVFCPAIHIVPDTRNISDRCRNTFFRRLFYFSVKSFRYHFLQIILSADHLCACGLDIPPFKIVQTPFKNV